MLLTGYIKWAGQFGGAPFEIRQCSPPTVSPPPFFYLGPPDLTFILFCSNDLLVLKRVNRSGFSYPFHPAKTISN